MMLTRFRNLSFLLAYAIATIPLWHYIRDGHILALMIIVVAFAYVNVVLSTVQVAQPILSSEKSKIPLPRWLPDKPKYHKWWILVRRTLKWHLLLIPPKMGLSLGFVQWLFLGSKTSKYLPFGHLHMYISYNTLSSDFVTPYRPSPQWVVVVIAIVCALLFSFLENSLITALCLATKRKSRILVKQFTPIIVLRLGSMVALYGIIYLSFVSIPHDGYWISSCGWANSEPYPGASEDYIEYIENAKPKCFEKRITETIFQALFTGIDQSILLNANIMRPIRPKTWEYSWTDNRPFVARQLVAGMLGLLLYAGATWVILWFVEEDKPPEIA